MKKIGDFIELIFYIIFNIIFFTFPPTVFIIWLIFNEERGSDTKKNIKFVLHTLWMILYIPAGFYLLSKYIGN